MSNWIPRHLAERWIEPKGLRRPSHLFDPANRGAMEPSGSPSEANRELGRRGRSHRQTWNSGIGSVGTPGRRTEPRLAGCGNSLFKPADI